MNISVEPELKSSCSVGNCARTRRRDVGALVLDGDYRGLAVVRSLGRRDIPVWVLQHGNQLLAAFSRYRRRTLAWPSERHDEMADFLIALADREGVRDWVLFPTDDSAAAMIARHRERLSECFQLTTPEWDVLQWVYDKRLTYQLADKVGVPRPWTMYPRDRTELAQGNYSFPVILKPAFHGPFNRFTAAKAWRVDSKQQLLARYDEAAGLVEPGRIMIQELIPGSGESQFSYTALCQAGEPLASLTARRIRQFPMDFGRASTFVETADDPESTEKARRLLRALHYTGLVEVEFKRDPRDAALKVLDINPRVWGWHSLCGFAGVDYPYLLWLLTIGERVPTTKATPGLRWVRMSTDAPTAIREVLAGRLSLRDYLRSIRPPLAPAIFASDDPLPGLLEFPLLAYLAGKRLLGGTGAV